MDFALYGTINPEDGVSKIAEQAEAGVAAFKFSTFGTHPVRFPRINPPLLGRSLRRSRQDRAHRRRAQRGRRERARRHRQGEGRRHHRLARPRHEPPAAHRVAGDGADLRNRRRHRLRGACRPLLAEPRLRHRRQLPRRRALPPPSSAASTTSSSTRKTTSAASAARPRSTRPSAPAPRSRRCGGRSRPAT